MTQIMVDILPETQQYLHAIMGNHPGVTFDKLAGHMLDAQVAYRLEVERMDGETLVVEDRVVSFDEAFRAEVHHFRDSVLSGKAPAITVDEAVKDARWIEAIGRSYVAAPPRDVD